MKSVCVLIILCAVVHTIYGHPTGKIRSLLDHHLIRRFTDRSSENNINGQHPEMMAVMGLIAKGCDDPNVMRLTMAFQRLLSSPLMDNAPIFAAPDNKPGIQDMLMISCAITNVDTFEEFAAVNGIPESDLRQLYPAFVQILRGFQTIIEFEQSHMDPSNGVEIFPGVDAFKEILDIMDEEGLFDLM